MITVFCIACTGHFLMATRDRHGAAWMNNSHISCCSLQGLQEILSTIYRGEKDLTKVHPTGKIIISLNINNILHRFKITLAQNVFAFRMYSPLVVKWPNSTLTSRGICSRHSLVQLLSCACAYCIYIANWSASCKLRFLTCSVQ